MLKINIYIYSVLFILFMILTYYFTKRKMLRDLLYHTCLAFNKFEVDYWVDFGSLLGIIRENDIIMFDMDADVCIINHDPEKMKKVDEYLRSKNLRVKKECNWDAYRGRYNNCFLKLFDAYIDIYMYKTDTINNMYISPIGENCDISMDLIGQPKFYKWRGIDIKVPQHMHKTLVYRYGEDYNIPKIGNKGRDS